MPGQPRSKEQRKADTLARLGAAVADVWVATTDGVRPFPVPLTMAWVGEREAGPPYLFAVLRPERIEAWREENELTGRRLMRDGVWLV
jgi:hypothetical protein